MVKKLDENTFPPLIDHVGWRLWRLARRWKATFDAEMTRLGYGFMAEARGEVLGHLRPAGAPQASIAAALGISKQAVQQLVDELDAEGIVARLPNPADARGKLVMLTAKGREALLAGNRVKQAIEAEYRGALGEAGFAALMQAFEILDGETD